MKISSNLRELSQIFTAKGTLYLVGGAVRNGILRLPIYDFDIASAVLPEAVVQLLVGTDYIITAMYPRTGTLLIERDGEKYEYTTFRTDSYPIGSGEHTPSEVQFTESMSIDARRRDFTCNALYYDIIGEQIIDLVEGVADINNKILRTVRDGEDTLGEDALRIMRLVRFAVQLGCEIDSKTYDAASKYARGLADISIERIEGELTAIINAPDKYNATYSDGRQVQPSDGVRLLVDIGAMRYIIPELLATIGVRQNEVYHLYEVYEHVLKTMDNAPPRVRLAGLLHDIAKPVMMELTGKMYGHEAKGEEMTRVILTRLKFASSEIERVSTLVGIHMFNYDNNAKDSTIRRFVANNKAYIDDYIALRTADCKASRRAGIPSEGTQRVARLRDEMIAAGVPTEAKQMDINGHEVTALGYSGAEIGEAMTLLLQEQITQGVRYTREYMIDRLRR